METLGTVVCGKQGFLGDSQFNALLRCWRHGLAFSVAGVGLQWDHPDCLPGGTSSRISCFEEISGLKDTYMESYKLRTLNPKPYKP